MFRVGICNELYRGWAFDRAFAHARECGYEGLEIAPHTLGDPATRFSASRVRQLQAAASQNELPIVGLHWLLAETKGLHWTSPDPAVREATADYFNRLIRLCGELGGLVMVLGSPRQRSLAPGISAKQGREFATRVVEAILPELARQRMILAVEPLGPEETNFLNTAAQVREFIAPFASPWVRLHLDVKAMSTEATPIGQIIAESRDALAHFHANDPNRRGPGMGEVDFVPILRALQAAHYRGWVSVEVFDESPGIDALAGDSIRNLRRDFARAIAL
jgi:sugar phosphate isomerase/epimerase